MPWAVAGAVVGVAGAAISSNATGKAAKGQQEAADRASALQQSNYQQTREDNLPALEARNNALLQMTDRAGKWNGEPTADQVMSTPGYQFGLQEGQNALEGSAAASGGLFSGNVGKALQRYGNDYATTKYDAAFNRMQSGQNAEFNRFASLAGAGQVGTSQIATTGQNTADAIGSIGQKNAANQGSAGIAQANLWTNTGNQAASTFKNSDWFSGGSNSPNTLSNMWGNRSYITDPTSYGAQNGSDVGWKPYADGGPVRNGVSVNRNALMQLLAGGGPVSGPGGPRSDSIPASLSDGEHVFDTAAVDAFGDGDNDLGQARLNKLRMLLKGK